jgi:mannosyltransferase
MTAPLRHARQVPLRKRDLPAWFAWPVVAGLTAASLVLAFFDLNKRSLWLDEGYTWLSARQSIHGVISIARTQGYHLLPYYLLIHFLTGWFGDSSFVLRAPSVVAGALAVPLLYLLVARLGGRLAGLYACVVFVVSEPLVFWQQNARDYALVVFFAVASTLAGVVAVQEERIWMFVVWGLVTALGCFTHTEMLLLLPPQLLVFIVWAQSLRVRVSLLAITGLGAVVSLPVLGQAAHSSVYSITPLSPPNHESATEIASFLASAAGNSASQTPVDHALLGITFALALIGVALLASDIVERGCTPMNMGLGVSLAWLVIPPVLSWVVSETGHPDFLDRYVILSLPAAAATVALVVIRANPRLLGMFVVMYLTIFRAGVLVGSYHVPIDDYRSASKVILAEARPGDCITFSSGPGRILWDYYSARRPARSYVPAQVLPDAVNGRPAVVLAYTNQPEALIRRAQHLVNVKQASLSCRHIWLLMSHYGNPTGNATYRYLYQSLHSLELNLAQYYSEDRHLTYPGVEVTFWSRVRNPTPASP